MQFKYFDFSDSVKICSTNVHHKYKSLQFEVPQWNISVNDSGIQVTLFWAEKGVSDEVPSGSGTDYFLF